MQLRIEHSLSDDTKRFVQSLADAFRHTIGMQLQQIIMTQTELKELLAGVATQQQKTITEIQTVQGTVTTLNAKVEELTGIIAAGGPITPELEAAAAEVKRLAQLTDDQIPDAPEPVPTA